MTSQSYRYDYEKDGQIIAVQVPEGRAECMRQACRASGRHGSAYAIRTQDGADTGQRVYHGGHFSHDDDDF